MKTSIKKEEKYCGKCLEYGMDGGNLCERWLICDNNCTCHVSKEDKCKNCGGDGYYVGTTSGHGCDGTQESCDMNCPVLIPVQEQCDECGGTGYTPQPPTETSWESRFDKKFGLGFTSLATPNEIRVKVKKFLIEELKSAEEKARREERERIENSFCGEMHLIRQSAGKNQLKLIAEIMKRFRWSLLDNK